MKKRSWIILLCPVLCCSAALGEDASARIVLSDNGGAWRNITSEAILGNTLYSLDSTSNELIICDLQDETADVQYSDAVIYDTRDETRYRTPICIFADSTQLYAIEAAYRSDGDADFTADGLGLYALSLENGLSDRLICELDSDALLGDDGSVYTVSDLAVTKDGHVALLYMTEDTTRCDVLNLADGSMQTLDYGDIAEIEALDDDEMLMLCKDGVLYRLDADLNATQLGELSSSARGLAVSAGTLYYMDTGAIYTISVDDLSSPQRMCNCRDGYTRGHLIGDKYLACGSRGAALCSKTDGDAQVTLCVGGNVQPSAMSGWFEIHPEVQRGENQDMAGEEYVSAFLTRSADADVYFFSTTNVSPYRELRDKGYLPPTDSSVIDSVVGEMYTEIQNAVTIDGEIVGVPISCTVNQGMGINKTLWAAIGKTEDEIPKTWSELMHFICNEWPTLAQEYPNVCLFESGEDKLLYWQIMNGYALMRDYYNNEKTYDDPLLRELLAMDESMNYESYAGSQAQPLFTEGTSPYDAGGDFSYMPLVFFSEDEPTVSMTLGIGVLNPYSENTDAARSLLEYLAENISKEDRLFMFPNPENEGLRYDSYEQDRQNSIDTIEALKQQLDANDNEIEQRQLEQDIEDEQAFLDRLDSVDGWQISPDGIAAYRILAENLAVSYDEAVSESDSQSLETLQDQYLAGEITSETYLDKLNRITSMREAEG